MSSSAEIPALRFFFDAGSGACLWTGKDAARARHDYPVDHRALALRPELKARLDALIARYDTSLDWSDPGGAAIWTVAETELFFCDARTALHALREELAGRYDVIDDL